MAEYGKIEKLTDSLKGYINTSYELNKLEAAERTSVIGASMISALMVALVGLMCLLFISLSASFYFSALLGNSYSGFAITAGFYFLLTVILLIGRKGIVEKPMRDKIIRIVFSKNS
jgi:hypothetical protein